jgi:hypothetical protein
LRIDEKKRGVLRIRCHLQYKLICGLVSIPHDRRALECLISDFWFGRAALPAKAGG